MKGYAEYIVDQLLHMGNITVKQMFGGFGIYKDGIIFGIIISSELYFKTNKESEKEFACLNSEPFSYNRGDKIIKMSYWKVPEEIIESRERLAEFAIKAHAVSSASRKTKLRT